MAKTQDLQRIADDLMKSIDDLSIEDRDHMATPLIPDENNSAIKSMLMIDDKLNSEDTVTGVQFSPHVEDDPKKKINLIKIDEAQS